jgi:alkaline phosphatase D
LWKHIVSEKPNLWIWLGDIVYADTRNMETMKTYYDIQKQKPWYQQLLKTCPVIGVWDDHDFGENNSGKDYPQKIRSQKLLLDFLNEPAESSRRKQEGVYVSYEIVFENHRIKIILPDERYFRDEPGKDADILGETQWRWLEQELKNDSAEITFIGSSTQLIPDEHWSEMWGDYPKSRERFFSMLKDSKKSGVIILSGDRHWGEISKMDDSPTGYPLYEITSSGMTHYKSWFAKTFLPTTNRYRIGEPYRDLNYGLMDIDFSQQPVMINFQIRDQWNITRLEEKVSLVSLQ